MILAIYLSVICGRPYITQKEKLREIQVADTLVKASVSPHRVDRNYTDEVILNIADVHLVAVRLHYTTHKTCMLLSKGDNNGS